MYFPTMEYRVCRPCDPDLGGIVRLRSHTMPVIAYADDKGDYWMIVDGQGLVWFVLVMAEGDCPHFRLSEYGKMLAECCEHHL